MRTLRPWLLLLGLVVLLPNVSRAQERAPGDTAQTQPQEQSTDMRRQMQAMTPMMADVMRAVTQSGLQALADPETARNLARFTRNYYEALMEQGFSEEQALRIVTSVGFPSMPSM